MLARSSYHASDGAAYELFLGRWSKRLAEAVLDAAGIGAPDEPGPRRRGRIPNSLKPPKNSPAQN